MSELIDTTEMYLRTVFELEEEGVVPKRARIVERLGHSGPTVSQTIARMERDGLVRVEDDRRLALTDEGRVLATRVMRKHRLAERLLSDVIGLEWHLVHDEACRWEHVMSEDVERRIVALLDGVEDSPYGNPIPGLAELGGRAPSPHRAPAPPAQPLSAITAAATVVVRRLDEHVQVDVEVLRTTNRAGLRPGEVVAVSPETGGWRVAPARRDDTAGQGEGEAVLVGRFVADHVLVEPLDDGVETAS